MIKEAVILAAGEGKRLKPFTETMPKVMLPVANKPILEYVVEALEKVGIDNIVIVIGYKKEIIQDYFKDYENITFVTQDKQLGTAHALLQAKKIIDDDFLVLAGDNIIDSMSISKLLDEKSKISMLVKESSIPSKYGVVFIEKNHLKKIVEKPKYESSKFISTGIYKFPRNIFEYIKKMASEGIYDLTSVIQFLLRKEERISVSFAELWQDVVYPWDLLDVNARMLDNKNSSIEGNIEKNVVIKGKVSVGKDTIIRSGSYIVGPTVIGENCEIGPNVSIFPSTSIGDNSTIHPFTEIRNSILMGEVEIGSMSFISHSIIGGGCKLENNFSALPGSATMEIEEEFMRIDKIGSIIGEDTSIGSHVVVEPGKIIGRKCIISSLKKVVNNIPSRSIVM